MTEFLTLIFYLIVITAVQKVLDFTFTAVKAENMIEPMHFACKSAGYFCLAWFVLVHLFEFLEELSGMVNFVF